MHARLDVQLIRIVCVAILVMAIAGCGSEPMRMEGRVDGEVVTTVKLEGPVQLQAQLQGPTIKYDGTYVSDELFEEIEVSKTGGDWIVAVLGKPDARAELKDGSEIWRWTYKPVEQQSSIVELWSKSEKEPKLATRTVFVQVRDDVVVRKWKG